MSARTFELTTVSHSPDELWIARVEGREALSALYRFDLVVITNEANLEESLLGKRATLRMRSATAERQIHGIISRASAHPRFRQTQGASEGISLRIRIVPLMWTLGLSRRSRIFQDLTVPEIVGEVLGAAAIPTRWSLAREHQPRLYCVQHQESDLAFVQRLLAEEGIFTYFEPLADEDRLVLVDSANGYDSIAGDPAVPFRPDREGASLEHLNKLGWARKLRPRALLRTAFDERRPHQDLRAHAERQATGVEGELHHHELGWDAFRTGDEATRIELERARHGADVVEAEGSLLRAFPGARFTPVDAPTSTLERGLAIVSVETSGWQPVVGVAAPSPESSRTPLHACKLRCVSDDVAHRPASRARPPLGGLETATVMGPLGEEIYTDEWGRIKIRFPWDVHGPNDDRASCWVRTTQALSGASFGVVATPRVGMGVVVGFLAGDPDRPIVLGTAYDGTHLPPFDLPADKTKTGLRTRSTPSSDGYSELSFDDAVGRERVHLRAERDLTTFVGQDCSREVVRDERIHVAGRRHVEVDGDGSHIARGNQVVTVQKNLLLHVVGRQHIVVDGLSDDVGESAGPPEEEAPDTLDRSVEATLLGATAAMGARAARVSMLVESLPDDLYDAGETARTQAHALRDVVLSLTQERDALVERYESLVEGGLAPSELMTRAGELRRQAELVATTARTARDAIARDSQNASPLEGAGEATAELRKALKDHVDDAASRADGAAREAALVSQMAGSIAESLGRVVPRFPAVPLGGVERGGGGGDDVFTKDGKVSKMTIKGGGVIEAPDGLTISSGGSSISITSAGITIKGDFVDVHGTPIKLNC